MDIKALNPAAEAADTAFRDKAKEVVETPKKVVEAGTDAVAVDISTSTASETENTRETKGGEESKTSSEVEDKRQVFEEVAAQFEKELNQTEVRFNVSVVDTGEGSNNDLRFQVVEKETGEVVREFPPERVLSHLKEGGGDNSLAGLFFADKA
jgi:uncharacterized FlaG/YvyC family protein